MTKQTFHLQIKNLAKSFPNHPLAVNDVSFNIEHGKTLGLVGESGSGKSTLAKIIMNLLKADTGTILYNGKHRSDFKNNLFFKRYQMIFQDPFSSLNPKMSIEQSLLEPIIIHNIVKKHQRRTEVAKLLDLVGIPKKSMNKYPHEMSGGQNQRIAIARALSVHPEFIIFDEAVSSLDVSVQAQIINLLVSLQKKMNLTYLFISHDIAIVKYISDDVAVMHKGKIVELKPTIQLFKEAKHWYAKKLLHIAQEKFVRTGLGS